MSFFPAGMPHGAFTFGDYAVFISQPVTPAVGAVLVGTTAPNVGSFIPTEAFIYCETGPAAATGTNLAITFNMGFTGVSYADWVSAATFGGDGSSPQIALNFIARKFKQLALIATSSTSGAGYAPGTPRNAATAMYANVTARTGVPTNETVRYILGGYYTGLR